MLAAYFGAVAYALSGFSVAHIFAGHVDIAITYAYPPLGPSVEAITLHSYPAFASHSCFLHSTLLHFCYLAVFWSFERALRFRGIAHTLVAGIVAALITQVRTRDARGT